MPIQIKILKHPRLEITEFDIKECNNSDQLAEWKMEIGKDNMEIQGKIDDAKMKAHAGEYMELDHWYKLQYAKRKQGLFLQMIQTRQSILKKVQGEHNKEET